MYYQLGIALQKAGDLTSARALLARAIEAYEQAARTSDVSFCVGVLARTMVHTDPTAALPVCRRYLELEAREGPKSTSHYLALEALGRCLVLLGEGEEAVRFLTEAKTMALERTKGHLRRWAADVDSEFEKARALIARTSK